MAAFISFQPFYCILYSSHLLASTLMATKQLLVSSATCSSSQLDSICVDCSSSPSGEQVNDICSLIRLDIICAADPDIGLPLTRKPEAKAAGKKTTWDDTRKKARVKKTTESV